MSHLQIRICGSTERLNATVASCSVQSALRAPQNAENGMLPGLGPEVFLECGPLCPVFSVMAAKAAVETGLG